MSRPEGVRPVTTVTIGWKSRAVVSEPFGSICRSLIVVSPSSSGVENARDGEGRAGSGICDPTFCAGGAEGLREARHGRAAHPGQCGGPAVLPRPGIGTFAVEADGEFGNQAECPPGAAELLPRGNPPKCGAQLPGAGTHRSSASLPVSGNSSNEADTLGKPMEKKNRVFQLRWADVAVQPMGAVALKGIAEPVRVFQISSRDLAARKFGPLRSLPPED